MTYLTTWIILLGLIFFANGVGTVAGFGSTIIALSIGVHFYPFKELVVVLVMIGWLLSIYIVSTGYRHTNWKLLAKRILPYCGFGLAVGRISFNYLNSDYLKILLGVFVIVVSGNELVRILRKQAHAKPLTLPQSIAVLTSGGIIHGLFSTGGPLVVYFTSREITDKTEFRSTLACLWLILSSTLLSSYAIDGMIHMSSIKLTGFLLPGLLMGIVVGEYLHTRVNEVTFRTVVQIILLFTGISLIIPGIMLIVQNVR